MCKFLTKPLTYCREMLTRPLSAGLAGVMRFSLSCAILSVCSVSFGQALTTYVDLYNFAQSGANGSEPSGGAVLDSNGNLYGTTYYGGSNGVGAVWEVTTGGKYVDLHDFGGLVTNANGSTGPDGQTPLDGITFDGAGNMYGTAEYGGANNEGMVWEITASGKYIDLHDFGGTVTIANGSSGPDGIQPLAGVTLDSGGNIYGAARGGGPNDGGVLWKITKSGSYKDLHDFGGTVINADGITGPDGTDPCRNLTFDKAGNLFGIAYEGGLNSVGMLWEFTNSGLYKDLHDFGGTVTNANGSVGPDGSYPVCGVTFDKSGNLYGTTNSGGPNENTGNFNNLGGIVWEYTPSGSYKDLHDFGGTVINASGTLGPDGTEPNQTLVFDSNGNIFGTADGGGAGQNGGQDGDGIIWEITSSGVYLDLHDFGGTVSYPNGASGPDGYYPAGGVTLDAMGNLYGTTVFGNGSASGGILWSLSKPIVKIKSLSISPSSVLGGTASTGTVTLASAATSGGTSVGLVSSSSSAIVPGAITIATGATTGTFTIKTAAVNASTAATITAGTGSGAQSATITITSAVLTTLSLSPTSVSGGVTSTGTVTLNGPAGPGGTSVALTSSSTSAVISSTVLVLAGQTSGTFTVTTKSVSSSTTATITASLNGTSKTANLTIIPAVLQSLGVSPSIIVGGGTSTGTVTLSGAAGANGFPVSLSSSITTVKVPKSVTVAAGQSEATFALITTGVSAPKVAAITAMGGTVSKTATLTVDPPTLQSVSLSPTTVAGGVSSTGTVSLSGPAPTSGVVVKLISNSKSATVLASVTVPSGKSTATFAVKTIAVSSQTTASISVSLNGVTQSATLTITSPTLTSLKLNPTSVAPGKPSTGTVTISSVAPANGVVVTLSSNQASATVPKTVTIPPGKASVTFTVKTATSAAKTTATISATSGGTTQTAILTIT